MSAQPHREYDAGTPACEVRTLSDCEDIVFQLDQSRGRDIAVFMCFGIFYRVRTVANRYGYWLRDPDYDLIGVYRRGVAAQQIFDDITED